MSPRMASAFDRFISRRSSSGTQRKGAECAYSHMIALELTSEPWTKTMSDSGWRKS
jgi:hypothetical protein